MTPLKILLVEDELITAMHLRQTLEKEGHQITGMARTFQDAQQLVVTNPPNLALVDIELASTSTGTGIDTARELLLHQPMPIIYLTANAEQDVFRAANNTHPAAYLLKPFKPSELLFTIELAWQNFQRRTPAPADASAPDYLMLPVNGGLDRIDFDEVTYLTADGAYARLFLADGTVHTVSTNLGQLEQYFPASRFYRLSRSHVVNLHCIKRLKDGKLQLTTQHEALPVPASSQKELLKRMTVIRTKHPNEKRE